MVYCNSGYILETDKDRDVFILTTDH